MMNGLCMHTHTEQLGMTNHFMSAFATKETRQGQMEEFTSWLAVDIRKFTEACHTPQSKGKPGILN